MVSSLAPAGPGQNSAGRADGRADEAECETGRIGHRLQHGQCESAVDEGLSAGWNGFWMCGDGTTAFRSLTRSRLSIAPQVPGTRPARERPRRVHLDRWPEWGAVKDQGTSRVITASWLSHDDDDDDDDDDDVDDGDEAHGIPRSDRVVVGPFGFRRWS